MEFLPQTSAKELENGLEEVAVCGYSILMAHVERYHCLESRGLLEKLKARYPVACQMNGFHGAGAGQLLEAAAGGTLAEQWCH